MENGNMNTKMLKPLGLIVLGGIAGGLAGYFLASLIIDQVLESQKEFEEEEENINIDIKVGLPPENFKKGVRKIDYTKFTEKGALEDLVRPYTEPPAKERSKQDNIRIISLEEYDSNRALNREPISYYEGDTTFCDANEDIIPNPEDFFGPNVHLHFGEQSEDPDIVYVRNENNGVSYEITRYKGKYSVIISGMPDEEPKIKPKRKRTTKIKKEEAFESEESIDDEGED